MRFYNHFLGPKGCFEDEGCLFWQIFRKRVNGELKGQFSTSDVCELVPKHGGSLKCFLCVVSLLGQRSTLRILFLLLLLLLVLTELSFPSHCGVCAQKLQEQE